LLNGNRMRIITGFVLILMIGCTGDLVEINVGAKQDLSFGDVDMAQGGGGEMGPSNVKFFPDITMDMDAKGCTAVACHGTAGDGSVMTVKMGTTAQADIDAGYASVMNEINTTSAMQSPFLLNPLVGSGSGHAGTTPFASTSDPTYVKWLAWIQAGAPKQ
jgi:hypothetical protein